MKQKVSYTIEEELIKKIINESKKQKRSCSYIVNELIKENLKWITKVHFY